MPVPPKVIELALGSAALGDARSSSSSWQEVTRYATGLRTRYEQRARASAPVAEGRPGWVPFETTVVGPGVKAVTRALSHELVKLERTPTVAESEYQVKTTGRPHGEVIVVQLIPGGREISLAPFVEGFREPEGELGRAAGRLLEGTVGLQLVTAGRWVWRLQLSRRFRNSVLDRVVGSEVGLVLLQRF